MGKIATRGGKGEVSGGVRGAPAAGALAGGDAGGDDDGVVGAGGEGRGLGALAQPHRDPRHLQLVIFCLSLGCNTI